MSADTGFPFGAYEVSCLCLPGDPYTFEIAWLENK